MSFVYGLLRAFSARASGAKKKTYISVSLFYNMLQARLELASARSAVRICVCECKCKLRTELNVSAVAPQRSEGA